MSIYSRHGATWRYLRGRTVKHALARSSDSTAICGTSPGGFFPRAEDWHGTGAQTEYEQVQRLPECRRCARLLTPTDHTSALASGQGLSADRPTTPSPS